jgi:hypothetical protein
VLGDQLCRMQAMSQFVTPGNTPGNGDTKATKEEVNERGAGQPVALYMQQSAEATLLSRASDELRRWSQLRGQATATAIIDNWSEELTAVFAKLRAWWGGSLMLFTLGHTFPQSVSPGDYQRMT